MFVIKICDSCIMCYCGPNLYRPLQALSNYAGPCTFSLNVL